MSDHIPVMLSEAVEALQVSSGKWFVDGTFGRGGHTREILNRGGKVIALDHDDEAIMLGQSTFSKEIKNSVVEFYHLNFALLGTIPNILDRKIAGILFDFGLSSAQLDEPERGFSFQQDAPLDMRMDRRLGVKARDLVNALGRKELYDLLTTYAQEFRARSIVESLLRSRIEKPIETTKELADIVEKAVGGRKTGKEGHLHPATKTFMALRMAVNDELGSIERALPTALDTVADGGRIVTISFHEGEDRLVKHAMQGWEKQGLGMQITKKPLEASEEEKQKNPRSRSAKLRVFEKGKKI
ncbi:MAG TPA: 16S rRNA (cytosine(1402)-N(4))-methyltransferase RsmH [Patescibacteria group bacterium]|nr:16S rRNA (cytosine(1402)-N(4))-methyltransferase RsmH [Patescibacteria group bacterium]